MPTQLTEPATGFMEEYTRLTNGLGLAAGESGSRLKDRWTYHLGGVDQLPWVVPVAGSVQLDKQPMTPAAAAALWHGVANTVRGHTPSFPPSNKVIGVPIAVPDPRTPGLALWAWLRKTTYRNIPTLRVMLAGWNQGFDPRGHRGENAGGRAWSCNTLFLNKEVGIMTPRMTSEARMAGLFAEVAMASDPESFRISFGTQERDQFVRTPGHESVVTGPEEGKPAFALQYEAGSLYVMARVAIDDGTSQYIAELNGRAGAWGWRTMTWVDPAIPLPRHCDPHGRVQVVEA